MAKEPLSLSIAQPKPVFQCPKCRAKVTTSDDRCPSCLTAVDLLAAEAASESMRRIDQACGEVRVIKMIPEVLWAPVKAYQWWSNYGDLRTNDPEFARAKREVKKIVRVWIVVFFILFTFCSTVFIIWSHKFEVGEFENALSSGNKSEVIETLKRHPGWRSYRLDFDRTPLALAAAGGHEEIAALLLNENVDASPRDDFGDTPLHESALGGHVEIVQLLLARQARVDARNNEGQTPLHLAAGGRGKLSSGGISAYCEVVNLLLANRADLNARDSRGRTPLHYAITSSAITELLLEKGANANIRDNDGKTPLAYARSQIGTDNTLGEIMWNPDDVDPGVLYYLGAPYDGAVPLHSTCTPRD
jgi:hypothetical protein